jgi:S-formylglutathione hydrolase FrmB
MRPFVLGALLVASLSPVACGGTPHWDTRGAAVERYTLKSKLARQDIDQTLVIPPGGGRGRPLLLLLHGRGAGANHLLSQEVFDKLRALGSHAPVVLVPSGGKHSYYHDRGDGAWGSYVIREAIPAALRRSHVDGNRIAIGGISMGGFGAFDLARLYPLMFCAVGGRAAAMWFRGADTPSGAFDDAEDFARHDVIGVASRGNPYGRMRVWIDVGEDDPFRQTDTALAQRLRAHGANVTFWLHSGGHGNFGHRMGTYLAFYARALAACAR